MKAQEDKRVMSAVKACDVLWAALCDTVYKYGVFWDTFYKEGEGEKERKKYVTCLRDTMRAIEKKVGTANPDAMWTCVRAHT